MKIKIVIVLTAPVFAITELRGAEPQASVWMNCPEFGGHEAPAGCRTETQESSVRINTHEAEDTDPHNANTYQTGPDICKLS